MGPYHAYLDSYIGPCTDGCWSMPIRMITSGLYSDILGGRLLVIRVRPGTGWRAQEGELLCLLRCDVSDSSPFRFACSSYGTIVSRGAAHMRDRIDIWDTLYIYPP
jgi:hypothetical protein